MLLEGSEKEILTTGEVSAKIEQMSAFCALLCALNAFRSISLSAFFIEILSAFAKDSSISFSALSESG
jgi:hypothetical protein